MIILKKEDALHSIDDIDRLVSAELPDPQLYPKLHNIVSSCLVHGPCGKHNPKKRCMQSGICKYHFPRDFQDCTTVSEDGYPRYRRQDNGRFVQSRSGVVLDNRWVVPHNVWLVSKYSCHINLEVLATTLKTVSLKLTFPA